MNSTQQGMLIAIAVGWIGSALVAHGFVTADQWTALGPLVTTAIGGVLALGAGIWVIASHSMSAHIAAVNDETNGVKVVANNAANAAVPTVNAPLPPPVPK